MEHLIEIVRRFVGKRVLVVGDVILDEYLIGRAARMSREAPIPVLEFEERRLIPGGAANPAANIAALGATAIQSGVIGADGEGEALKGTLTERRIEIAGLLVDGSRSTTVKTRIMAQMGLRFPQQVARLDRLARDPITPSLEAHLIAWMERAIPSVDAVLLSDYHGGLLTPTLVDRIARVARDVRRDPAPLLTADAQRPPVLLTADAQGELGKYSGFDAVKCNADEARAFLARRLRTDDDFAAAALDLRDRLGLRVGMFITRGADGITFAAVDEDGDHYAAHSRAPAAIDVYDTVGAGDTSIAVITLALACGAAAVAAAALANAAGGIVVQHVGNYAPTMGEMIAALAP
ncbi:MAG: PfkB family carbohydrate kinase [Chloroflexota bacterium]|nr:PfkB family carbohydrate kinase [Chloroflexota bacterium]